MQPLSPVYVISKGRWDNPLTVRALEFMGVEFFLVVEPQEADNYRAAVKDHRCVVTLPFSNLGQGSIPARNWVWDNAVELGARRHWIIDDNIRWFRRLHENRKISSATGTIFRAAEDFVERYENIGIAGFQYSFLCPRKTRWPPFVKNTRVYSCILIKNDLPLRWRGRYNEDTDLSLRVLKMGMCTILFNAFLADKQATMTMKGGNTDELYKGDGRLQMALSLQEQHPDVTNVVRKWGRWQHSVNYGPFKNNKLVLRQDAYIPDGDPYPMAVVEAR